MSSSCPNPPDAEATAATSAASSASCTKGGGGGPAHRSVYRRLPKILLLGDSLTQLSWEGWGAHIANIYQRRADVLNRGFSGYNTRFFLRLLPDILRDEQLSVSPSLSANNSPEQNGQEEQDEPTVVLTILFFGANDAAIAGLDNHHYVPLDEYRDNLHQMVNLVQRETHCRRFLLVTPPPVHHAQRLAFQIEKYGPENATGVLERTLDNTGRYAQACRDVATRWQLPCLDLYRDMQKDTADTSTVNDDANADSWGRFFYDGLHFSQPGHDFVGRAMIQAINLAFGDELHVQPDPRTGQWCNSASTSPSALLLLGSSSQKTTMGAGGGPYHDVIDATDPDQSFAEYHKYAE